MPICFLNKHCHARKLIKGFVLLCNKKKNKTKLRKAGRDKGLIILSVNSVS